MIGHDHVMTGDLELRALLDRIDARDRTASDAIYALGPEDADLAPALIRELARRPSGESRVMIVRALGQIGAGEGSGTLVACLDDPDVWMRVHALVSLAAVGWTDDATPGRIAAFATSDHGMTRIGALGALAGQRGERAAVAELAGLARAAGIAEASWALQMLCDASARHAWVIPLLVALLDHRSDEFRETIALTLRQRDPADAVPALLAAADLRDGGVLLALRELGERARPWAAEVTSRILDALLEGTARSWALRALAGAAVERERVDATLDVMIEWASGGDLELAEALARAVRAAPEDREVRARYGRFLDRAGDPRGEAIRIALADEHDPRLAELIEMFGDDWTDGFPPASYRYRLGLPWHASVDDLVAFAGASSWRFRQQPIGSLALRVRPEDAEALRAILAQWLPALFELAITGVLDAEALDAIARAPRLRTLALDSDLDAAVRTLVDLQAPLTKLTLAAGPSERVLDALLGGALPRLRVLVLPGEVLEIKPSATSRSGCGGPREPS